jgi:hypothetical protein
LPFPGEPWQPKVDIAASVQRLAKVGVAIPQKPALADEVKRALELRLHCNYGPDGNRPKDIHGRDAVDLWVAGAGLAMTTEILVEACKRGHHQASRPAQFGDAPYNVRTDGLPWSRLREHLVAASEGDRADARKVAAAARKAKKQAGNELGPAVAYAFCDDAWVAEDLEAALEHGYGRLCLLAALATPAQAKHALEVMKTEAPKYMLLENGYTHMPNLMVRLADADADLVIDICEMAWNKAVRKPWLDIAACLSTPRAIGFLEEHGAPGAALAKKAVPKKKAKKK